MTDSGAPLLARPLREKWALQHAPPNSFVSRSLTCNSFRMTILRHTHMCKPLILNDRGVGEGGSKLINFALKTKDLHDFHRLQSAKSAPIFAPKPHHFPRFHRNSQFPGKKMRAQSLAALSSQPEAQSSQLDMIFSRFPSSRRIHVIFPP